MYCTGGDHSGAHADGGSGLKGCYNTFCEECAWDKDQALHCVRCSVCDGKALQLQPIRRMSKARSTKRLKLKYDKLLSIFAFNLSLRRCTTAPYAPRAARPR